MKSQDVLSVIFVGLICTDIYDVRKILRTCTIAQFKNIVCSDQTLHQ